MLCNNLHLLHGISKNHGLGLKSCQCGMAGQSGGLQVCAAPRTRAPLSLFFVVLRASPSIPGVSAHLRPLIVALREELEHSLADEDGRKEQCLRVCVLFMEKVIFEAELMNSCVSAYACASFQISSFLPLFQSFVLFIYCFTVLSI